MPRRVSNASGLRQLLLDEQRRSLRRWGTGKPDPLVDGLAAGEPVMVSSAQLLKALSAAGLPHEDYSYGGRAWGRTFVLDERDQLAEYAG